MGQTVDVMVDGGKATAGATMGQALGPLGLDMGAIISAINEKTKDFAGMQVPVKIIVDDDKTFKITVGTPPTTAMIKKETHLEKLSGQPKTEKLADMKMQQIIKIAKNKLDDFNTSIPRSAVKQVVGTCVSSGVMVEGKDPKEVMDEIEAGKYDDLINNWKTDISAEELAHLEEERKELKKHAEDMHKEQKVVADKIIAENPNKSRKDLVALLHDAEVPTDLINELLPEEEKKE